MGGTTAIVMGFCDGFELGALEGAWLGLLVGAGVETVTKPPYCRIG
jgi:hypothetical protein